MIQYLYALTQIVLGLLLVFWAATNTRRFLYAAAFLIPLQGLGIRFFVSLSWYELLVPVAVLGAIVGRKELRARGLPGLKPLLLLLAYAVGLTAVMWYVDWSITGYSQRGLGLGWGTAQSTLRYPVQLLSYLFVWSMPLIGAWYARGEEDVMALINGYINGNVLNIAVGFYQVIALGFGLPWLDTMGITFQDRSLSMRTVLTRSPFTVHRLFGLGGEPKHTAGFAVMAIGLLMVLYLFASSKRVRFANAKLAALIAGVILTGSTAGWIALVVVLSYLAINALIAAKSRLVRLLPVLAGLTIVLAYAVSAAGFAMPALQDRFTGRVSGGLLDLIEQEPKDAAFVRFAQAEPEDLLLGSGAGGVDFRLIPYTDPGFLTYGATVTPGFFISRLLGDLGVVGLVLALLVWIAWYRCMRDKNRAMSQYLVVGILALASSVSAALPAYLLLGGGMVAVAARRRELADGTDGSVSREGVASSLGSPL